MTYSSDIAKTRHAVGYYVAFDGIEQRLATHDFGARNGLEGTYLPVLVGAPSGGGSKLDRQQSLVLPGGLGFRAADSPAVRELVRRHGGTEGVLAATLSPSSTTVDVGSELYAAGTTIYVEQETIVLGNYDAGEGAYTGSTRGAFGSVAAHHPSGAIVSTVPRHWLGRRVRLFAVNLATGSQKAIRTVVLSSSPRFLDGVWVFDAIDLMRVLRRPINKGWFPQAWTSWSIPSFYETRYSVPNAAAFVDDAIAPGYLRITDNGRTQIVRLTPGDVDAEAGTILTHAVNVVHAQGDWATDSTSWWVQTGDSGSEIQQVAFFAGDAATVALMLMLSDRGDGANHATYDVLPGRGPAAEGDALPARVGAALPAAWVDIEAWEALRGIGGELRVFLDEPLTLLEFLVDEICPILGGYLFVSDLGQLSFRRWRAAVPAGALVEAGAVVTEDDLLLGQVDSVEDESQVMATAMWETNWDPLFRQHLRRVQVAWGDQVGIYGDELATLERRSRTIWVGPASESPLVSPPYGNELQLVFALDRHYARTRRGVRTLTRSLPWSRHVDYVPGKLFLYTDPRVPDHEGGKGQVQAQYEVVRAEPNYGRGVVRITAEQVPDGYLVAPSFVVGSFTSGGGFFPDGITPDLTGDEADLFDASPEQDLPDLCTVRVYDASASPPFSVSGTSVCQVLEGGILIVANFGFTPAAGDLVVLEYSENTGNLNAEGADVRDHLFQTDDNGNLNTNEEGTVWA